MASIDWDSQIWAPAFAELRVYLPPAIASGTLSTRTIPFIQEFIDKGTCSPIADPKKIGDWALKNVPDWSECVLEFSLVNTAASVNKNALVNCIVLRLQSATQKNRVLIKERSLGRE